MEFVEYMPEEFAEEIDPKEISNRPVKELLLVEGVRPWSL